MSRIELKGGLTKLRFVVTQMRPCGHLLEPELSLLITFGNSEGCGETLLMRSLARDINARICGKPLFMSRAYDGMVLCG